MRGIRNVGLWLVLVLTMSTVAASTALATSVGVMAWGSNGVGQLGDGGGPISDEPVSLSEPADVTSVSGGDQFSLALLKNDTVMSWGSRESGELGRSGAEDVPGEVSGLTEVTAISAGGTHSLALLKNETVRAWGNNFSGQVGDGTMKNTKATPVEVHGLIEVTAISAGYLHSLALLGDRKVVAWGDNKAGELGDGTTTNRDEPVEVHGLSEVLAISAGGEYSLALLKSGTVMAWGKNSSGQLGDGTTSDRHEPVEVKGLTEEVTAISASKGLAGVAHSLALLKGGKVVAWGNNEDGQLGDGTTTSRYEPVEVSGLTKVAAISADGAHSLALSEKGAVQAWGRNSSGQLGDGTSTGPETCGSTACSRTPVGVSELSQDVAGISAGEEHSLAYGTGPIVTKLEPNTGTPLGGVTVLVSGYNFTEVTAVKFDTTSASSFKVLSATLLEAVSPPGKGTVHVNVTTLSGTVPTSGSSTGSRFMYVTPEAPEFGRCKKVTKGTGKYNLNCAGGEPEGAHEWTPGVTKTHFTLSGGEATLETVAKTKIVCKAESGTGEYSGTKKVKSITIKLTECESAGSKCTTSGAGTGEIVTTSLEGKLGWKNFEAGTAALDLFPVGETGPFAEFSCGSTAVAVQGSVLVAIKTYGMTKELTLKYEQSKGKQKPESFESEPADVLETSFAGGAYEQTGLTLTSTLTSEEEVEVNPAV
jgi:alpha-tubulin suppressor-like RCC1 family protein